MRTRVVQSVTFSQRGRASWYGPGFHGRRTANGERFDTAKMTAAHRTLPFGTRAKVCTRRRCVTVRINDRGPFIAGRVVDLSHAAASALGITSSGVARVTVSVVESTAIREPIPTSVRPAATAPAARPAPRASTAAPAPALAANSEIPLTVPAASSGGSVGLLGLAALSGFAVLFSAGPVFAIRRRRVGLDFLR